jgi:hypothetical protein
MRSFFHINRSSDWAKIVRQREVLLLHIIELARSGKDVVAFVENVNF